MDYQLYRNTTIGNTLQESLDELIQNGHLTPEAAAKVMLQYDKSINRALANNVKTKITFNASKLNTYRLCDDVWTFMMTDVKFRGPNHVIHVDKVKMVACDGKRGEERK